MIVPAGGASVALTPIPYQAALFYDDGLPGKADEGVVDATAGRLNVAVQGFYHLGITFHGGDPTGAAPNMPGPITEVAITARAVGTGDPTVLRRVANVCRPGNQVFSGAGANPAQTSGKYPWTLASQYSTSALWQLQRGAIVEFSVRQLQAVAAYGGAPNATKARPWIFSAWAYLVSAY
jgi:hypothetical protein